MKIHFLALFLFFTLGLQATWAQVESTANSRPPILDILDQMKDGALIVRVPTNAKKMTAIKDALSKPGISASQHKRLSEQLATTQAETEAFYQDIRKSFYNFYKWSAIYFLPDYAVSDFLDGNRKGQFLNEEMVLDPSIVLVEENYWFGVINNPTDPTGSIYKSIVVKDANWENLPAPFPHTKENLGTKLRIVFSGIEEAGEWAPLVDKFQQRLIKVYTKYAESMAP